MYFKIINYIYFEGYPDKFKLSLKELKTYDYDIITFNYYKFINLKNIKFLNDKSNAICAYFEKIKDYSYYSKNNHYNKYLTYLNNIK